MLYNIPNCVSPELLKILMEMGHSDEIVLADGNFPAASHAKRLVRLDGLSIPEVLASILTLFPLDTYVEYPVVYMDVPSSECEPEIWKKYKDIFSQTKTPDINIEKIERHSFYERAKKAYAIVSTSETALYANLIIKKGVIS